MNRLLCLPFFLGLVGFSFAQDGTGTTHNKTLAHSVQLAQTGRFGDAIASLRNVQTLRSYNLQSTWLHAIGDTRKAIPLLEKAHQHFPNDLATLRNLIVLHFYLGNRNESRKHLRRLSLITPQTDESFEIQKIAIIVDNEDEALSRIDRLRGLHEKFPSETWAIDFLAKLLVRQRDRDGLIEMLDRQADSRSKSGIIDTTKTKPNSDSSGNIDARKVFEESGLTALLPADLIFEDFDTESEFIAWLASSIGGNRGCEPIKLKSGAAVGQSAAHSFSSAKRGTVIVLSPSLIIQGEGKYIHDEFWHALAFEILNRHAAEEFSNLNSLARQGLIGEMDYVKGVAEIEHSNLLLAVDVYYRLVRPSLSPSKSSDPLLWRIETPSSFNSFFNAYKPTDYYPFGCYGAKYRLLRHRGFLPDVDGRIPAE